jgi:hypothetical protein
MSKVRDDHACPTFGDVVIANGILWLTFRQHLA